MKKGMIVTKKSKIILCVALLLFIPSIILDILQNNNVFIHIYKLNFNVTKISPLFLVIAIVLFAIVMISIIIKNTKSKLVCSVTIVVVVTLLSYAGIIQLFMYQNESYKEFVSPDNKHVILVSETGVFQSGVIKFYEKTSPFVIEKIGVCNTDDCYAPIENNTYEIKWDDNGFEFCYDFTGSGEVYKIENIEYIK